MVHGKLLFLIVVKEALGFRCGSSMTMTSDPRNRLDISKEQMESRISPFESAPSTKSQRAAPLVDSTLLRFISSQNNENNESSYTDAYSSKEANGASERYLNSLDTEPKERQFKSKTNGIGKTSVVKTNRKLSEGNPEIPSVLESAGAVGNSWITQYSAERIAILLIAKGAEKKSAAEAGMAIENHAQIRLRRNVLRRYLKDREQVWAASSSCDEVLNNTDRSSSALRKRDNDGEMIQEEEEEEKGNVEEIVDFLTESGLTGKDCADIFCHTPGLATMRPRNVFKNHTGEEGSADSGETLEETLQRSFHDILCGTLGLRKYDARKVLRNCPGLLTMRGSHAAEQVITILSSLGASAKSLARDKASLPNLLSRTPASLFQFVSFLSSDAVRMSVDKIGPLIRRSECRELLDAVCPIPQPASIGTGVVPPGAELDQLIPPNNSEGKPKDDPIRTIYRKMWATAETLLTEIGIVDMSKVLSAYPGVLLLDREKQIIPVVEHLIFDLDIPEEDVPRMLESYPSLLSIDVEDMRKVEEFLLSHEVSKEAMGKIFRAFPSLWAHDVQTQMIPVVDFLHDVGVMNIGRFITRLPPVLGYSVEEELSPKWEFLCEVCQFNYFEIVRFPAYFSYPLENVIKARYEYLRLKGIASEVLSVDNVLRFGEADFAKVVAGDRDGGNAFRNFLGRRRKSKRKVKTERNIVKTERNIVNMERNMKKKVTSKV